MSRHQKSEAAPPAGRGGRWLALAAVAAGAAAVISLTALAHGGTARPEAARPAAATGALPLPASTGSGTSTASGSGSTMAAHPAAASAYQIAIQNYAFSPASLTVQVGDTVTWTNEDSAPHTVTVTSGPVKFDSGTLQKGQSYSYTFGTAGTYSYYCAVHPDMTGKVVVGAAAPPSSSPTTAPSTAPSSAGPAPTGGSGSQCGAFEATVTTFLQHLYAAHLEESPGQQLGDILNLDQYVKMHTTLIANMLAPQTDAVLGGSDALLTTFLAHVYAAHLEESPGQQVNDISNVDQYVEMHTTLIVNMLKPLVGAELGSC
jgi:amicyanin